MRRLAAALLALAAPAFAAPPRLAVLEFSGDGLSHAELALMSDEVRGAVASTLQGQVLVVTRDNMDAILTDMGVDPSCVAEGACEVETARNLSAQYVVVGSVVHLDGSWVASLRLYEARRGALEGLARAEGADLAGLLHGLAPATAELLAAHRGAWGSVEELPPARADAPRLAVTLAPARPSMQSPLLGELRWVPPGRFDMGSPARETGRDDDEGAVDVTLPHGMWVMRTEVTQAAYTAVVGKNPSRAKRCDACPVDSVSWEDAVAFAEELSRREGVTYRLPTEAEWEWAARGAEPYPYAGAEQLERVAWYDGNSGGGPHPACSLEPNGFGLCDMSGNVWEWTHDGYASKLPGGVDPLGVGADRVVRGGAWSVTTTGLRLANRAWQNPTLRLPHVGFRLVTPGP